MPLRLGFAAHTVEIGFEIQRPVVQSLDSHLLNGFAIQEHLELLGQGIYFQENLLSLKLLANVVVALADLHGAVGLNPSFVELTVYFLQPVVGVDLFRQRRQCRQIGNGHA